MPPTKWTAFIGLAASVLMMAIHLVLLFLLSIVSFSSAWAQNAAVTGQARPISPSTGIRKHWLREVYSGKGETVLAVWTESGPPYKTYIGRFTAEGEPLDGEGFSVWSLPQDVVALPNGDFEAIFLVYENSGGSGTFALVSRRIAGAGEFTISPPRRLMPLDDWRAASAALDGDELVLAAAHRDGTIHVQRFDARRARIGAAERLHVKVDPTSYVSRLFLKRIPRGFLLAWMESWESIFGSPPDAVSVVTLDSDGRLVSDRTVELMANVSSHGAPLRMTPGPDVVLYSDSQLFAFAPDGSLSSEFFLPLNVGAAEPLPHDPSRLAVVFGGWQRQEQRLAFLDPRFAADINALSRTSIHVPAADRARIASTADQLLLFTDRDDEIHVQTLYPAVQPLEPPGRLQVSASAGSKVWLEWEAPSRGSEEEFQIEYQNDNPWLPFREVGRVSSQHHAVTVSDLPEGRTMFRIRAARGAELSPPSSVDVTYLPTKELSPYITSITPKREGEVVVAWADPVKRRVATYVVYGIEAESGRLQRYELNSAGCAMRISGLKADTEYFFTIFAMYAITGPPYSLEYSTPFGPDVRYRTPLPRKRPVRGF